MSMVLDHFDTLLLSHELNWFLLSLRTFRIGTCIFAFSFSFFLIFSITFILFHHLLSCCHSNPLICTFGIICKLKLLSNLIKIIFLFFMISHDIWLPNLLLIVLHNISWMTFQVLLVWFHIVLIWAYMPVSLHEVVHRYDSKIISPKQSLNWFVSLILWINSNILVFDILQTQWDCNQVLNSITRSFLDMIKKEEINNVVVDVRVRNSFADQHSIIMI